MKKLFLVLLLVAGVIMPCRVMSQSGHATLTIGNGTSTGYTTPFNTYYKNSTQEIIYTAAEIGASGLIDTIWFKAASSTGLPCTSLKVYMGITTASSFASNSSWLLAGSLEQVFDAGAITLGGTTGWYAIPLQTPYFYSGSDNLVIAITKTATTYNNSCTWYYTSTTDNRVLYRQYDSDTTYGDLTSLTASTTGTLSTSRPNIKIGIDTALTGCVRPRNFTVTNLTENSATLTWRGCEDALTYQVCFGTTNNINTYVATPQTATDTTYYFDNLDDSTTYYVWVRTLCANDTTAWASFSFTTAVACARVADAAVDSVSESMAIVTWRNDGTGGQNLDHVLIQYKAADATSWITDSVYSDTSYVITGLQDGTDYMVRIIAICTEDTSNMVSLTFETPTCGEYAGATTTNGYVPFNGTYNYGYSQTIYPASGLAGVSTISGIYFNTSTVPPNYTTRTVTIALGNTSQTTLSTSNYVAYSSMTEVASNVSMDVSTAGWVYIPFSTPFAYDGSSNVVVAVSNLTGHWSGFQFNHHTPIMGNAVYWYQDSGPISTSSPSATSSGTTTTVPDIRFDADCGGGSSSICQRPTDLSVDLVDFNSVDLSWTGCTYADSYEVRYGTSSTFNDSLAVTASASSDIYTLTGLRANTTYYIWVRSICGEDASAWSSSVSATTLEACATLVDAHIDDTSNTYITLSWSVNTSVGHPLTQVVVAWRAVGDATWNSDVVVGSTSYILTGLRSGVSYELTLTSVCGSDSSDAVSLPFTTPACYEYVGASSTTNGYVPFNGNYDYGYSQTIYPATALADVDTIRGISFRTVSAPLSYPTRPVSISIGNTTRTSLSTSNYIAASAMTEVVSNYPMDVSTPGWVYIPFTTPFVYDGTSNVVVAVTNHTGDYSSFSFSHHSTTVGNAIYWYRDSNPISASAPAGTSGTTTTVPDIRFDAPCNLSGCTPPAMIVSRVGVTDIQIMWMPTGGEEEWLVGYKTGNGEWTYTTVTTTSYTFSDLSEETLYSLCVGALCGDDTAFVYKTATTLSSGTGIDCITPYGLAPTATTHTSMTLVWYVLGFEQQWEVRIYNDDLDSIITATSTTLQIEDLMELTEYHIQVRAICDEGEYSAWSAPIDVTTPEATYECVTPIQLEVIAATDSSFVLTWVPQGRENKWQVRVYNYAFDSSYRAYSPNVVVGGMSPMTSYNVKVRAVCGVGDTSDWSVSTYYTTRSYADVDEVTDGADVRIYPNPTSHSATVAVSGVSGRVSISVLDLRGRIVRMEQMECEASCVKTFQVEGLAQGAYFVRIQSDNLSTVRKLFVE